jgi:hypothetical protein
LLQFTDGQSVLLFFTEPIHRAETILYLARRFELCVFQDEFKIYYIRIPKEKITAATSPPEKLEIKAPKKITDDKSNSQKFKGLFGSADKFMKKSEKSHVLSSG